MMHQDYLSMMLNQSPCSYCLYYSFSSNGISLIFREDEPSTTSISSSSSYRSIITPKLAKNNKFCFLSKNDSVLFSEAARRIAASGIPILSSSQTEPSISRALSIRHTTPTLDRVPSRTIRPPPLPPSQPRIPINQLPRIQRRIDAPSRPRPRPLPASRPAPAPSTQTSNPTPLTTPSFIDHLLNSQERLHNLQNVRMHG